MSIRLRRIPGQRNVNTPSNAAMKEYFTAFGKVVSLRRASRNSHEEVTFANAEQALKAQSVLKHVINGFRLETLDSSE